MLLWLMLQSGFDLCVVDRHRMPHIPYSVSTSVGMVLLRLKPLGIRLSK
jgi:hypothetical protein